MIFIGAIVPQDVGVHDARTYRHVLVKLICRTGKRVRERGNGFGNGETGSGTSYLFGKVGFPLL